MNVEKDGFYIFKSLNDSYGVEHLRIRTDYSHMIARLIEGPFEDIVRPDGRIVLSGYKTAHLKLSEILAEVSDKGWIPSAKTETASA